MGIVFRNGDFKTLATKIRGIPEDMLEDLEPLLLRTVDTGADLMEAHIETRGTVKSGKRGRVETGRMLGAVDSEVFKRGTTLVGRWGWLNEWEKYFLYQENGFRNAWSREDVAPMHALYDSFFHQREALFSELAKKLRRRR